MDPAGTLLSIAQIIVILTDFADSFDEAPRTLSSIRAQIRVVEAGVKRIQEWMHFTDPTSKAVIQESLQEAIATVDDSVGSLKEDLDLILYSGPKMTKLLGRQGSDRWSQTKFAWNEPKLSKHLTDMRECALLLSFTLTVCQLPLGRPAEHAIEELGIGARTLSRAHKSTREKRRSMLTEAKIHASEDQSVDFKVFLEGVLDAEKTLPEETDSEESSPTSDTQALSAARSPEESTAGYSPSSTNLAKAGEPSVPRYAGTRSDELFLDGPLARSAGGPIPPPKIGLDMVGTGSTTTKIPEDHADKEAYLPTDQITDTRPTVAPEAHLQTDVSSALVANTGTARSPAKTSPVLSQKTLPRKPILKSPLRGKLEEQSNSTYSSEKIMVRSDEFAPLEVVKSPEDCTQKQVSVEESQSPSPPPYATPKPSQVLPSSIRSQISSSRSNSHLFHKFSTNENSLSRQMESPADAYSTSGCPEIIQAVREDLVHRVEELVQQRDNVYALDPRTGRTALLEATERSHRELCRLLLKAGSRPNHQDIEGRSALHKAAIRGDSVICRMLLAAEASATLRDSQSRTPLWLASQAGSHEAVASLLEVTPHKTINDTEVLGAFYEAVKVGDVASAEAFLVKHVELKSVKEPGKLAAYAALSGSTQMLDLVLVQKSSLKAADPEGLNALHHAAKQGHTAMIDRLLDMGVPWKSQTKQRKETALHLAIANHQHSAALLLIQHKSAKVTLTDTEDQEPIHLATRTGAFDLATALLARGAKLKPRNSYGWRPLHLAAAYGHIALMAQFITHGLDLNDPLASPSFKPSKKTNQAAQQSLWAEIRWPHEEARALHLAIEFGHAEMAKLLLASGAKLDAADSQRWQPLHYAAFHCLPEVVEVLLERGASPHAKTQDGNTPLSLGFRQHGLTASQEDRDRVQYLLQAAGAEQTRSALSQVMQFRLGAAGTRSARERNLVWHTAEMAEALYRDRGDDDDGEGTWDGESQGSSGERRPSAMSSSLTLPNSQGVDRRMSHLSLRKSLT